MMWRETEREGGTERDRQWRRERYRKRERERDRERERENKITQREGKNSQGAGQCRTRYIWAGPVQTSSNHTATHTQV